jgi:hypothetical protein
MFKKISGLSFPLFLVLPFAGFITALMDVRTRLSGLVYVSFAMLFGFAISFTDASADSYRYAQAFKQFDNTLDYNTILELYQNGELRDLYRLLLFYFVSIFTDNPKIMYSFAGLVFGILSYHSLLIFVKERGEKWDKYILILTLCFFTFISLANINGFRFWTGALLLFFATYNFILERKTLWFILILITPLFHYGFILIVPVFILYRFIQPFLYNSKGVKYILFYAFVFFFILSWGLGTNSINLSFLTQSDALSGAVGERIEYVNSADVASIIEKRRQDSLFLNVQKYFDYFIKIYIFISLVFLFRNHKKNEEIEKEHSILLAFVLFFYSVAFIATSIPSGGRFLNIAHLFFFLLLVKFYVDFELKNIRTLIFIALPVFSFNILFTNGLLPIMIVSPTFWYGNVFWIISEGLN